MRNHRFSRKLAIALATILALSQAGCRPISTKFGPLLRRDNATVAPVREFASQVPALSADSASTVSASQTESLELVRHVSTEQLTPEQGLSDLVAEALANGPEIRRLEAEAGAAWQRVPQARALPDPMLEGTVFGVPQVMADGEMRGTLMISQNIPYFKQLNAQGQEAAFEALMLQQETEAARLSLVADVEESWYRLYLLGQLMRINEANRQLASSLLQVATSRVEVGAATTGDAVLGTLELARVEEERVMLEQQLASRKALLNRLLNRPADSTLQTPNVLTELQPGLSLEDLRSAAFSRQPEIVAARLRTEATAWGVRAARLKQVPDVRVSYEHMFMRMNPGESGSDPWRVGVGINVPLWRGKYVAMQQEAGQRNFAAHQGVEEAIREYDSMLVDLREQALAAERTARLFRETILPQSRQAFEADQRAYGQGAVTFERVIGDTQNLITAESALHRAMTERAIAIARIKQAAGGVLSPAVEELALPPPLHLFPDE
jgi:outer membrane protein TolC